VQCQSSFTRETAPRTAQQLETRNEDEKEFSAAMRAVELGVGAKLVQNATRKPRKVQKLKLIA
jgi:hypothetical protein